MDRPRAARFFALAAGLAAVVAMPSAMKRWPKAQTVHYVFGDAASKVEELDARWAEGEKADEVVREVDFRYPRGQAPRIASHEPRLSDGDYSVEIDLVAGGEHARALRHVTLGGGVTSIDLSALAAASARADANRGEPQ